MSEHTDSQLLQYASLYTYFILTKSGSWLIATFQKEYIYPSEMSKHCCPHTVATTALCVARNCPMGISHRHTGNSHALPHTYKHTCKHIPCAGMSATVSSSHHIHIHISSSAPTPPPKSSCRASPSVVACP